MNPGESQEYTDEYDSIVDEIRAQSETVAKLSNELHDLIQEGGALKVRLAEDAAAIRSAKSNNTRYLKELEEREKRITDFIDESEGRKKEIAEALKGIKVSEETATNRLASIDSLKAKSKENKELITEYKSDCASLLVSLKKLSDESEEILKELRGGRKRGQANRQGPGRERGGGHR